MMALKTTVRLRIVDHRCRYVQAWNVMRRHVLDVRGGSKILEVAGTQSNSR